MYDDVDTTFRLCANPSRKLPWARTSSLRNLSSEEIPFYLSSLSLPPIRSNDGLVEAWTLAIPSIKSGTTKRDANQIQPPAWRSSSTHKEHRLHATHPSRSHLYAASSASRPSLYIITFQPKQMVFQLQSLPCPPPRTSCTSPEAILFPVDRLIRSSRIQRLRSVMTWLPASNSHVFQRIMIGKSLLASCRMLQQESQGSWQMLVFETLGNGHSHFFIALRGSNRLKMLAVWAKDEYRLGTAVFLDFVRAVVE